MKPPHFFSKKIRNTSMIIAELVVVGVLFGVLLVYGQVLLGRVINSNNSSLQTNEELYTQTVKTSADTETSDSLSSVAQKYSLLESITSASSTSVEQKRLILNEVSQVQSSSTVLSPAEKMQFLKGL